MKSTRRESVSTSNQERREASNRAQLNGLIVGELRAHSQWGRAELPPPAMVTRSRARPWRALAGALTAAGLCRVRFWDP